MELTKTRIGPDGWALLGGVRFLLATVVATRHIVDMPGPGSRVLSGIAELGPLSAVLAFLVLSGFSIAHSLDRRPDGFYRRRFVRIYPLYAMAVLAAIAPYALTRQFHLRDWKQVAYNLAFAQTYRTLPVPGNAVVWTLAVEVTFYALAPLLRRLPTAALLGLTGTSAAAFAVYPLTGAAYYAVELRGGPTLFLGWAWLAGFVYHRARDHWAAGAALVAVPVILTTLNPTYMNYRWAMVTLAGTMATLVASPHVRLSAWVCRPATLLGDLSYPLYLSHYPVLLTYVWACHGRAEWAVFGWAMAFAGLLLGVDTALRRPLLSAITAITERSVAGRPPNRPAGEATGTAAEFAPSVPAAPTIATPTSAGSP